MIFIIKITFYSWDKIRCASVLYLVYIYSLLEWICLFSGIIHFFGFFFFLKCVIELTDAVDWDWSFVCGNVFHNWFDSFSGFKKSHGRKKKKNPMFPAYYWARVGKLRIHLICPFHVIFKFIGRKCSNYPFSVVLISMISVGIFLFFLDNYPKLFILLFLSLSWPTWFFATWLA